MSTSASESNATLAAPIAKPAEEAIPDLLEAHGGCLYQLGLRICGTHQEAEDLVQDTFLLAFKHWAQFRGDSSPKTWLYSIAARVCQRTKRLRAGQPKHLDSFEDLIPSQEDAVPDVWSRSDPLQAALDSEGREILSTAISELPLDFRMPLVLKDIAELPVKDVAAVLELKEATVKTRVHRARLHLRRILAGTLPVKQNACVSGEQICLDLVTAKLEAMDRGVPFAVSDELLCQRCEALFETLDLTQGVCRTIGVGDLPDSLRERLVAAGVAT